MYTMRALSRSEGKVGGDTRAAAAAAARRHGEAAAAGAGHGGDHARGSAVGLARHLVAVGGARGDGERVDLGAAVRLVGAEAHHVDLLRAQAGDAPRAVVLGVAREEHLLLAGRALELLGDERGAARRDRGGARARRVTSADARTARAPLANPPPRAVSRVFLFALARAQCAFAAEMDAIVARVRSRGRRACGRSASTGARACVAPRAGGAFPTLEVSSRQMTNNGACGDDLDPIESENRP